MHPRIILFIGIVCVSIFPILVKVTPVSELVSVFYRLGIAAFLFLITALISGSFKVVRKRMMFLAIISGILFAADIAVWNMAISLSSATQASLLTNLAPVWVGIGAYFFLKDKPRPNFWIGTIFALFGMAFLVGWKYFLAFDFDKGFVLAVLSSLIYAVYIIISKRVLNELSVLNFMTWSMLAAAVFLFTLMLVFKVDAIGFSYATWSSLLVQGIVCQFLGWLCISYALKNMRANRVSLSLLLSVVLTGFFAWLFIGEKITGEMIFGGFLVLVGIAITFKEKQLIAQKS